MNRTVATRGALLSISFFGMFAKSNPADSASLDAAAAPVAPASPPLALGGPPKNLPAVYQGGSPSLGHPQTLPKDVGVNPSGLFQYGFPGPVHDLALRDEFVSCYDRRNRIPYWVAEHITKESIQRQDGVDRKKSLFKEDENIPLQFRALLKDYFRSGYDRGHQAPAADAKFSQKAMDETFALTNIAPQVGDGFNRDYWAHLEDFCRRLTQKYDLVRIVTGPLFLPKLYPDGKYRVLYEVIGNPPNVAVPTHFFKLIIGERKNDTRVLVGAFVLPNDRISNETKLTDFEVSVDALERSSGLSFFGKGVGVKKLCGEVKCEIIVRDFKKIAGKVE